MRTNLPVTGKEIVLKDDEIIVSKTNLKGQITYVNQTFQDISGFSEQELLGEPHNIVRHPDMPVEAFEDFWRDLKAGRPWVGYVKNRCKNGDHYWVETHATPIVENDQVVGYLSVRKKPARAMVDTCERVYAQFRNKQAGGLRIEHGAVKSGGRVRSALANISFVRKVAALMALVALLLLVIGGMGLNGTRKAQESLQTVYADRAVPLKDLDEIAQRSLRNRILIMDELITPTQ